MRNFIFRLHKYAGLSVGLLLAMSGLTGALLVFGDELDSLLNPALLHVEARGAAHAPVQKMLDAAQQVYPQEKAARIRLPRDEQSSCEICFAARENPRCVYLDPYDGRVLGTRVPAHSLKARVISLHRRLLSGETGETIIGVCGLLLLAMSLSGLFLWWPGRRNLARGWKINWRGSTYRINYDLHRLTGICVMLFLMVNAMTGAAMVFRPSFEGLLNRFDGAPNNPPAKPVSHPDPMLQTLSTDEILRRAEAALPNAVPTIVTLPAAAAATFNVRLRQAGELHPSGRSIVYLDQYSGEVRLVENAFQAPLGTRAGHNLYPIHVGQWGGRLTRVIQVAVGLTLPLLFCTGLLMWRTRTRSDARRKRAL